MLKRLFLATANRKALKMTWPPDYYQEYLKRLKNIEFLNKNPNAIDALKILYSNNPVLFINDWGITYDPRSEGIKKMPFILFQRQKEFVTFLQYCITEKESGLVEKSRDMGATWLCCAYSVWLWLFKPNSAIGWGSRKENLVDTIGDPDSIFEKMRMLIFELPSFFIPKGFDFKKHMTYMKIINPENGAVITGESGDNIGRGGRSSIYFKDEAAHYERPEKIEAALGDNTDVQIDISSVNGTGNVFYRRRMAGQEWNETEPREKGKVQVFIFDWRDNPLKSQEWYDQRRKKAEEEGLLHLFAQEVDRDYTSSKDRIVIPAKWVKSAIDAHIKLGIKNDGEKVAGLDVADEGGDKNALTIRYGVIMQACDDWGEGDAGETARKAISMCKEASVGQLYYDAVGVGSGIKSETNRMIKEGQISTSLRIIPWNGGSSVINPEKHIIPQDRQSPTNEDFYSNLKAQAWWSLRNRFEKTYKVITQGAKYPHEELISIPSTLPKLHQIVNELSQPTFDYNGKGKLQIEKKPDGTKSPNLADSINMCYFPMRTTTIFDVLR